MKLFPNTNVPDKHDMSTWRDKVVRQHCVKVVAIGCKVVVLKNVLKGRYHGCIAVVAGFKTRLDVVSSIQVHLDDGS